MRYYDLKIHVRSPLDADADDQFITKIRAVVNCYECTNADHEPDPIRAGTALAYFVHSNRALDAGDSIFDVCDMHSHELMQCYSVLFTKGEYNEDIREYSPATSSPDFLFLDRIEIYPAHRGRGLGLLVARRLMDIFEPYDGIVVCLPCPLQFYSAGTDAAISKRLGLSKFKMNEPDARRKLKAYWQRLGFVSLGDSAYLIHSPMFDVPSFDELARTFDHG